MSSKNVRPARAWSLAARLTAWYAGSAFLLVTLATSYLYWAMLTNVDREDDALLADKVRVVRAVLQQRPGDGAAVRQQVEDTWDARQNEKTYVRVVTKPGPAELRVVLVQGKDVVRLQAEAGAVELRLGAPGGNVVATVPSGNAACPDARP